MLVHLTRRSVRLGQLLLKFPELFLFRLHVIVELLYFLAQCLLHLIVLAVLLLFFIGEQERGANQLVGLLECVAQTLDCLHAAEGYFLVGGVGAVRIWVHVFKVQHFGQVTLALQHFVYAVFQFDVLNNTRSALRVFTNRLDVKILP